MNRYLILFGSFLLLFTACSPDTETPSCNRTNNEVIIRQEAEPDRLNPHLTTTAYSRQVYEQIYTPLLTFHPQTFEIIPALAKARPVVEKVTEGKYVGQTAYHFEIFDDAAWSDGSPVTGYDYVFSVKTIYIPQLPTQRYRPYLSVISDVVVDEANPKKFTVYSASNHMSTEEYISNTIMVIPEHVFDANQSLRAHPFTDFIDEAKVARFSENEGIQKFIEVFMSPEASRDAAFIQGSGPYTLKEWQSGQQIVLEKKANWWGDKHSNESQFLVAFPDQLIYKIIADEATTLAAIKSEEIDVASNILPKDFLALKDNPDVNGCYEFQTPASLVMYMLYINTKSPLLNDKKVRQAIAHSIDVDEMIDVIFKGFARRTATPVHPDATYYNNDLPLRDYNIEKAKTLLKEAGWEDTNQNGTVDKMIGGELKELVIKYQYVGKSERSKTVSLLIQEQAKKSGIGIELVPLEPNVLIGNINQGNYELSSGGRSVPPTAWSPKQNWSTTGTNRTGFGNAATDALIDQIETSTDEAARKGLYMKLQEIIYDDQPEIFLFVPTERLISHKRFDMKPTAMMPGYYPNEFKLKK